MHLLGARVIGDIGTCAHSGEYQAQSRRMFSIAYHEVNRGGTSLSTRCGHVNTTGHCGGVDGAGAAKR